MTFVRLILPVLTLLLLTACGLAEDERDEENKYIYITFSDQAFKAYCLEGFDSDKDGRISRYEARRIREIVCPSRGIRSLYEIGEFAYLESIDCRGNEIAELDLRKCALLRRVNCSQNALVSLDVRGLRGLTSLTCNSNLLPLLDLTSTVSIAALDARSNRFETLDLSSCSAFLKANTRDNAKLKTIYCLASQSVDCDGHTSVEIR